MDAIGVKDVIVVGIADFTDGGSDNLIVVKLGSGRDFARNDDKIRFHEGFAGNTAGGVLTQT